MSKYLSELQSAIKSNKSQDIIKSCETKLANYIDDVFNLKEFYQLPLNNLLNVIKESDFSSIDDQLHIIKTIIQNTVDYYPDSAALLLHSFDLENCFLTLEDCIGIIKCFKTCKICQRLCDLYQEYQQLPEKDFSGEIAKKDKILNQYKIQLGLQPPPEKTPFPILTIVPDKFSKSTIIAAKNGDLKSLQYHLEVLHKKKELLLKHSNPKTPDPRIKLIHHACRYGNFPIVKYLVEQQKVNINSPLFNGVTPLHIACAKGYFSIVQVLVENGANLEATEKRYNETPLFAAYYNMHMHVVDYLISKGANINHKNLNGYKANQQELIHNTPIFLPYWHDNEFIIYYWIDEWESLYHKGEWSPKYMQASISRTSKQWFANGFCTYGNYASKIKTDNHPTLRAFVKGDTLEVTYDFE